MGDFLLVSIVASAVLTIVLNVALRLWRPDPERWFRSEPRDRRAVPPAGEDGRADDEDGDGDPLVGRVRRPGFRLYVPWKAMLVVSIGLTVLVNVLALLVR